MSMIPCSIDTAHDNLRSHFDEAPISIDGLQAMARWRSHENDHIADIARVRVAKNLASIQERDVDWIALASDVCGLAADDLRDNIAHGGDNVLLATLIDICRRAIHSPSPYWMGLVALTQFNIHHTFPGLQHAFCTLWNEIAQEARSQEPYSPCVSLRILWRIRNLYISLHQGTPAAPTAFSASTDDSTDVLFRPSSYPFCNVASHRPSSTTHLHLPDSRAISISTQRSGSPDASPSPPLP
jgi:hypothetical protein